MGFFDGKGMSKITRLGWGVPSSIHRSYIRRDETKSPAFVTKCGLFSKHYQCENTYLIERGELRVRISTTDTDEIGKVIDKVDLIDEISHQ